MDDTEAQVIAPKLPTALIYVGVFALGLWGTIDFQWFGTKILFGLIAAYGLLCFFATKSWRTFVAIWINSKSDLTNSSDKEKPSM
jgi:hypothetical protein